MSVVLSRPKRRRPQWQRLTVAAVDRLTDEAVGVSFAVPAESRGLFDFAAGQHLTLRRESPDGEELRRSYSICSTARLLREEGLLRVGIKQVPEGEFSGYANTGLNPGDEVEVLPPLGSFGGPNAERWRAGEVESRHYAGIVAGSGITPVLSIVTTALETEPESRVTLLFGNRASGTVMFVDELADLKDRFPDRFHLIHVLSREPQASRLLHGRLDPERLTEIFADLVPLDDVDDWYLCGPYGLVTGARQTLLDAGVASGHVHTELFFAEEVPPPPRPENAPQGDTELTVMLDGRSSTVTMGKDEAVLDAALRVRGELPYACKGGVCATCRARLVDGKVHMARNFALDEADLDAGYILTCQSRPETDNLTVDYDA
ncbi:ring-1,2-phenylacetyl-CoA epoxidase subunit PaaE [Stackebrandtia albiflava]|uniref:Ring-1,2-phenylacetyl-CoA epoxidase subunit PaaE n=1 Tax=Stackebrandtia albiflava TaxID=406432 RepID=A0A562UXW8_9ACTN|nr:1,2-phenylacetyl-CoA epoxidase subunit PaaE [Stackebrandtia albiflava]TWJ10469.1 ring-1,2-phenylacetyl-CoA epoxidase subunit PaaE [Stackebrandtia albiflava]